LIRVVKLYREARYDRDRGGLRSWILGIAKYRILEWRRTRAGEAGAVDESVSGIADPTPWDAAFEMEWRGQILSHAFRLLREETGLGDRRVRAFEMTAREGKPIDEVAAELGLTSNAVYVARHECMARLRALSDDLERRYEGA